jgi:glycosyltransferase involved in cell wall biosynthesis
MKVAIIRGEVLNKWEMQSFEPLAGGEFDLVACGADDAAYPLDAITLPVRRFPLKSARFNRSGRAGRLAVKLGLRRRPADELVGLEEFLGDFQIAHAAETHLAVSEQAARAKQHYGLKLVLTCWETIPHAYEEDEEVRRRRAFVRDAADLFLATTPRAGAALATEGVSADRIRVVMPGVDLARFRPAPRPTALAEQLGVRPDDVVFLFVGRLIPEKGVRELVLAFAAMLRSLPSELGCRCKLLIAGNGPLRGFLEFLIGSHGLADKARVIGGLDYMRVHELHQLADVFVLPSIPAPYWEEQFGMVLAEAMACGKPVISTHSGAIPEVVGDAGLLVSPLDVPALGAALATLASDGRRRREFGAAARARAVACFDADHCARQIADAYRTILLKGASVPQPAGGANRRTFEAA